MNDDDDFSIEVDLSDAMATDVGSEVMPVEGLAKPDDMPWGYWSDAETDADKLEAMALWEGEKLYQAAENERRKEEVERADGIRVTYKGQTYAPFNHENVAHEFHSLSPENQEVLRKALAKGEILDEYGDRLGAVERRRRIADYLGTYDHLPGVGEHPEIGPARWLIPGAFRWGSILMLGGPPKAGKSTLGVNLLAAVMNGPWEGTKFLDYFDVTSVTRSDLSHRDVWYINAENPPDALEEAMLAVDLGPWLENDSDSGLIVEHLEYLGGAGSFDLTDQYNYEQWEYRIGTNESEPPLLMILDGLTAVLGGSTARYGEWFAKLRDLAKSLKIPNVLVIAHSTLEGSHLMGGVEAQAGSDGNWNLQRTKNGTRIFSIDARMGGVSLGGLPVRLDPDGAMRAGANRPAAAASPSNLGGIADHHGGAAPVQAANFPKRNLKVEVLKAVMDFDAAGVQPSGSKIRNAVQGRHDDIDAALTALVDSGQIVKVKATGRSGGGGFVYRPVALAP